MKASIEEIKAKEGGGIEVVLSIGRPLAPSKTTYHASKVEQFEEDHKAFKQELQRFTTLHLGEVELSQEEAGQ